MCSFSIFKKSGIPAGFRYKRSGSPRAGSRRGLAVLGGGPVSRRVVELQIVG